MKTILFLDEVCPKPYDSSTLYTESQGGTESTVTRVAEGLAETGVFLVCVEQHNRTEAFTKSQKTFYCPLGETSHADYVICLRNPESLRKARSRFPDAKIYLWCHDLWHPGLAQFTLPILNETKTTSLIAVSEFHKAQMKEVMLGMPFKGKTNFKVSYPPVDTSLKYEATEYDPYQLVWLSSPHKGLEKALEIFKLIREQDPRFKFVVHNPGYFSNYEKEIPEGVILQAPGNYHVSINTVRHSLCVFYPNMVFPETFGLVFAEADTVGTPVLTHGIGSAQEVLDHPQEWMDCTKTGRVIERVLAWSQGSRPTVRGKSHFKLSRVIYNWIQNILV